MIEHLFGRYVSTSQFRYNWESQCFFALIEDITPFDSVVLLQNSRITLVSHKTGKMANFYLHNVDVNPENDSEKCYCLMPDGETIKRVPELLGVCMNILELG